MDSQKDAVEVVPVPNPGPISSPALADDDSGISEASFVVEALEELSRKHEMKRRRKNAQFWKCATTQVLGIISLFMLGTFFVQLMITYSVNKEEELVLIGLIFGFCACVFGIGFLLCCFLVTCPSHCEPVEISQV